MMDKKIDGDLVIPDRLKDILLETKQTVAVAESVTAGHLQVAFSMSERASEYFQGGITTYNLGQKARHLHIEPIHAQACDCVSENVASAMATHVTRLFMSDWGIAITGYASTVPEKNIYDLFACYSICNSDGKILTKTIKAIKGTPEEIRKFYTRQVLQEFLEMITA
jgi:PncC family amidohydrolase